MKTRTLAFLALTLAFSLYPSSLSAGSPLGTSFNYQGRLADGGSPASGNYDLRFVIYDALADGNAVGGPLTNAVVVSDGLFTVILDFGAGVFDGNARWLEIGVRTNGSPGDFTTLSPRQALTPSPYALYAPNAGAAVTATSAGAVATNSVANAGLQSNAVTTDKIADGTVAAGDLSPALLSNTFWRLDGNAATTPGTHFLGTTDSQALELRVDKIRAVRLEPNSNAAPNVIEGSPVNFVTAGVVGATIGGGGATNYPGSPRTTNSVSSDFGTIGGGLNNLIQSGSKWTTIGGGVDNIIGTNSSRSTIGGGVQNTIQSASYSTIAGGVLNTIQSGGTWSTIGGGLWNTNTGYYATIPGGKENVATNYTFAAGRRAKANHPGGFVWADNTDVDYATTSSNQFLIRAGGGVGIGTNNPQSALHVAGTVTADNFAGSGAGLTGIGSSGIEAGAISNLALAPGAVTADKVAAGQVVKSVNGLKDDITLVAGANIALATNGNQIQISSAGGAGTSGWALTGNAGTAAGVNFVGTTDNQPLEMKVNGARALRLEPATVPGFPGLVVPNLIGGYYLNKISVSNYASTIAGGYLNDIGTNSAFGAIGGGADNNIGAGSGGSVIGGGFYNDIGTNSLMSTVGGGNQNDIADHATNSVIAGGRNNDIGVKAYDGAIGGGNNNQIADEAHDSVIAGGETNTIGWWAPDSTISGGQGNTISAQASSSVIAGGSGNSIGMATTDTAIGGGWRNTVGANTHASVIAGGQLNGIGANSADGAIGGGYGNVIGPNSVHATIPGGGYNYAGNWAFAAGHRAIATNDGTFVWADSQDWNFTSTAANQFLIRASGGVGIGTNNPHAALQVNGTAIVNVLTILGGADVAEPFEMSSAGIPKGAVVIIDEQNPGHLRLSERAYDPRVAGIVSGANGIQPGLTLSQPGVGQGGQPVALSGRVYCLADSCNGPIRPGDLLTTSSTPGHAMKVTNHPQAQGAILGKAMTGLRDGRGMVLVLVSLQ